MKNTDLPETHKFIPAAEVLKSFKSSKDAFAPLSDIEKKIAKLEEEAAIRMAIDTFLDCSADKVKVSNRIPKSPRSARMLKVK